MSGTSFGIDRTKYSCDFETTVLPEEMEQTETEVWLAGFCKLYTEDCIVVKSIQRWWEIALTLAEYESIDLYFHNEKFDGSFIIDYFIRTLQLKQAKYNTGDKTTTEKFYEDKKMPKNTFKYLISDKGQWYSITYRTKRGYYIRIYDSYKLLPYSLSRIGKSFHTKHQKSTMEYEGIRYSGCDVSKEEMEYFENDLYVLKEALEHMFNNGNTRMTIGSNCLAKYKQMIGKDDWKVFFPDMYKREIEPEIYGVENAGRYIRKSYRGAWTYLVPERANKICNNGITVDVNSLYPSMMHSASGNKYPLGQPKFWTGSEIPEIAQNETHYYFVRVRTSFKLREGYLPTIQIKHDWRYKSTEFLTTSAIKIDEEYIEYEYDDDGNITPITVELTLTETDWKLINEHYELSNTEIIDGCYFGAEVGIFDDYINDYMEIKKHSKGAQREEAKLFLNNLYGKMATSPNSSFKVAYMDGEEIKFRTVPEESKPAGYIPVGSAITSYSRNFTIRHAQANYHPEGHGFIYADTDSLHMDIPASEMKEIMVDPVELCCWKVESNWDDAIFVRAKTYIEHITHEDEEPVNPYYKVTCAGMPDRCKNLLVHSLKMSKSYGETDEDINVSRETLKGLKKDEEDFLVPRKMEDFKIGLCVPSKLMPKRIKGGILLKRTTFYMREV